jgi:hypothetical protein
MDDIGVLEAAHDVHKSFNIPDMPQEFVAESFAFAGSLYQSGDIHELHGGIGFLGRMKDSGDSIQSLIGNADNTDIGVDCAKRIIGNLGTCGRQCIKYGGLSYVRQSDNPASETHFLLLRSISNRIGG